jgi:hypothetical protein
MQAKCALTVLSGVLLLTGGCMHSPAEKSQPAKPAYNEHQSVSGAQTGAPARAGAVDSQDMLNNMAQDLARRLGLKEPGFQVVSIQSVVWDDSSLGCPQPERAYLPAQTPGVRVVFLYENKTYQYHGSERGAFLYCEHPAVPALDEK